MTLVKKYETLITKELKRIGADSLGSCASICCECYHDGERIMARIWDDWADCDLNASTLITRLYNIKDNYCLRAEFEGNTDYWDAIIGEED